MVLKYVESENQKGVGHKWPLRELTLVLLQWIFLAVRMISDFTGAGDVKASVWCDLRCPSPLSIRQVNPQNPHTVGAFFPFLLDFWSSGSPQCQWAAELQCWFELRTWNCCDQNGFQGDVTGGFCLFFTSISVWKLAKLRNSGSQSRGLVRGLCLQPPSVSGDI